MNDDLSVVSLPSRGEMWFKPLSEAGRTWCTSSMGHEKRLGEGYTVAPDKSDELVSQAQQSGLQVKVV